MNMLERVCLHQALKKLDQENGQTLLPKEQEMDDAIAMFQRNKKIEIRCNFTTFFAEASKSLKEAQGKKIRRINQLFNATEKNIFVI
jgi:hypothetical protein